jgi:DNA-binding NarL/FixJ family response regulator
MKPIRVLLADDHAMLREGLRALLSSMGDIEVVAEVANGREAVRRALELAPQVVLMDIGMPDMNGVEATALLLAKLPGVRVIALSMHGDAEHVQRALQAGAAGYLLKESAAAEVVAAVRAVHAGRRYLSIAVMPHARRRAGTTTPLASLSARERQVLQLVVEGRTSAEIGAALHLSRKTVDTYRSRLMRKLGVHDLPALVKFAIQHGITPPA